MTASLRRDIEADLDTFYKRARRDAARALRAHGEHAAADALPDTCPYPFDHLLAEDWYPPNRHGHPDPAP